MIQKRIWTDDNRLDLLEKLNEIEQDLARMNAAVLEQQKKLEKLEAIAPTPLQQIQRRSKVKNG